ncbi:hypothetical protein OIO90_005672 [Microbotryomycetes sp. JL221]|nr:hypothetical protein OIO90_005672 [Microbotryomycetes sp. JL221]
MAPDRPQTTTSFAESLATGKPMSSHGPNHSPSLLRGLACVACRHRKVRCDGKEPACGACTKSAIAHGENPSSIVCNYAEDGKKRKRGVGGQAKVQQLQARIDELENLLSQARPGGEASVATMHGMQMEGQTQTLSQMGSQMPFVAGTSSATLANPNLDLLLQASGQSISTSTSAPPSVFQANSSNTSAQIVELPFSTSSDASESFPFAPQMNATGTDRTILDILYPGWPNDLPSPDLVNRLVNVYFAKNHAASGMLNPQKFFAAMSLPPTNNGFPHSALLHAVLATAVRMVSVDFFGFEHRYWGEEATPADYHAKRARVHVEEAIITGRRLMQVLQASILLSFYSYSRARFVEVWLSCGLSTRIATPLGLNHLKGASEPTGGFLAAMRKPTLLPPTDDQEELNERATAFWLAFMADRFSSASTGWATSLDETDVSTVIPSATGVYSIGNTETSVMSPRHPHFLISHPPQHVQGFQLYIKSVILFGRVVNYLHRLPTETAWKVGNIRGREPAADLRMTPDFKQLDADAVAFRLSVPRHFMDVVQGAHEDNRYCLVFALPHTATILLHEPFCTTKPGDVSMERCVLSAKAILEAIFTLFSTSFDVGLLCPFINYCWAIAGRTLVRELAIKQHRGTTEGVDQLRSGIQCILAAMKGFSAELGKSTAMSLQLLYDDPSQCLPHDELQTIGGGQGVSQTYEMDMNKVPLPCSASGPPPTLKMRSFGLGQPETSAVRGNDTSRGTSVGSSPVSFELATPPAFSSSNSSTMLNPILSSSTLTSASTISVEPSISTFKNSTTSLSSSFQPNLFGSMNSSVTTSVPQYLSNQFNSSSSSSTTTTTSSSMYYSSNGAISEIETRSTPSLPFETRHSFENKRQDTMMSGSTLIGSGLQQQETHQGGFFG